MNSFLWKTYHNLHTAQNMVLKSNVIESLMCNNIYVGKRAQTRVTQPSPRQLVLSQCKPHHWSSEGNTTQTPFMTDIKERVCPGD